MRQFNVGVRGAPAESIMDNNAAAAADQFVVKYLDVVRSAVEQTGFVSIFVTDKSFGITWKFDLIP